MLKTIFDRRTELRGQKYEQGGNDDNTYGAAAESGLGRSINLVHKFTLIRTGFYLSQQSLRCGKIVVTYSLAFTRDVCLSDTWSKHPSVVAQYSTMNKADVEVE